MPAPNYIRPFWYALADFVTASLAWGLFYFLRKKILGEPFTVDYKFWLGVVFIPAGWLVIYGLVGAYHSVYRKSRLAEITNTFVCSLIGCIVLFFLFLVDDAKTSYGYYYAAFFTCLPSVVSGESVVRGKAANTSPAIFNAFTILSFA